MGNLASRFGNRVRTTGADSFNNNNPDNRRGQKAATVFKSDAPVRQTVVGEENKTRLLPLIVTDYFVFPYKAHYGMGSDKSSFVCPKTFKERCVVCDYGSELWQNGKQKAAPKYWSKDTSCTYLIDRKKKANEANPELQQFSPSNEEAIRGVMVDKDTKAILSVNDLDEGYDLYFTKKETDKEVNGRKINEIGDFGLSRNPSPLGSDEDVERWLTYIEEHPIDSWFNRYSDEDMLRIAGIQVKDADDESETGGGRDDEQSADSSSEAPAAPAKAASEMTPAERVAAIRNKIGQK